MNDKTYTVYVNGEIVDTEAKRGDVDLYMELHLDVPVAAVENADRHGIRGESICRPAR